MICDACGARYFGLRKSWESDVPRFVFLHTMGMPPGPPHMTEVIPNLGSEKPDLAIRVPGKVTPNPYNSYSLVKLTGHRTYIKGPEALPDSETCIKTHGKAECSAYFPHGSYSKHPRDF